MTKRGHFEILFCSMLRTKLRERFAVALKRNLRPMSLGKYLLHFVLFWLKNVYFHHKIVYFAPFDEDL